MLTEIKIKSVIPGEKPYRLADEHGLYLEVAPSGGKWWRLKYRFAGKEKRISLGVHPEVSIKEARLKRDDAKRLLAQGIDPSHNRKAQKTARGIRAGNSFEVVAREWFAQYAPSKAPSHTIRIMQMFERDVFPWIGGRPVAEVDPQELLSVMRRIESRGAVDTAHRSLTTCGMVFQYAVGTGRAPRDPSQDIRSVLKPRPAKKHFAAAIEPEHVASILRMFETYEGNLIVRSALQIGPMLVVRPGELRQAEWKDVSLEKAEWRFLVTKTHTPHIVPLSRQAVEILRELQPLTGHGQYVFPGISPTRPMSNNAVLAAYRRMGIPSEELCAHGWRATFRTLCDEVLSYPLDVIEHQLAHTVKDPLGRAYNRTTKLDERRRLMQEWADYLVGLKSASINAGTVARALPAKD